MALMRSTSAMTATSQGIGMPSAGSEGGQLAAAAATTIPSAAAAGGDVEMDRVESERNAVIMKAVEKTSEDQPRRVESSA